MKKLIYYPIVLFALIGALLIPNYGCNKEEKELSDSTNIVIKDRATIVKDYKEIYLTTDVTNIGWTVDANNCDAGTIPSDVQEKVLRRINYFRTLAGLNGNITFNETKNAKCQKAALIFLANNKLDHHPASTWLCYTAEGAEAAGKSNIYLGAHTSDAITGYIEDPGESNKACGHRRWILYSEAKEMGHGSTPRSDALWVIGGNQTSTNLPEFITWPPQGYVPSELVFPKWSFAIPSADFANTQIQMTNQNNENISLNILSFKDKGYGDNTIIWEPANINTSSESDVKYNVKINNVKLKNGTSKNYAYDVIIIQP